MKPKSQKWARTRKQSRRFKQRELRWRITPERLKELMALQDTLLERGATHTAPGGRLVYATCSLFQEENGDQVKAFLGAHPEFALVPAPHRREYQSRGAG